jgi:alanine racemase
VTSRGRLAIAARVTSPPLRLTLDSDALVSNWRWLQRSGGRAACGAAIKADGYGLGARKALELLAGAGCRDFFVATWDEAGALGDLPDGISLSVLHGLREADLAVALQHPARPVLNSAAQVRRWREAAPYRSCDVMIDTGMNRLGLGADEVRAGVLGGLAIETLMSHLACADEPGHAMNEAQLFAFRGLKAGIQAQRFSLANSAGICLGQRYAFNLTRPGLALYGGVPVPAAAEHLRQVVRIEAELIQVREVPTGGTIGYGATFTADRPMRVGILNLGYADGYARAFGNVGRAWAGPHMCPVLGRVSMDLTAVDLREAGDAGEGDWLEIDYDLAEQSSAANISQYELLTRLGRRYQRRWT